MLSPPSTPRLDDEDAEIVRRTLEDKIIEIQKLPSSGLVVLRDIELPDGKATPVAHGLGRPVSWVLASLRGAVSAGYVNEVRANGGPDRSRFVVLQPAGYGATVTVDLWVL